MALYKIQNCKNDTEVYFVLSDIPLTVGSIYVFNFIPISNEVPPKDGYCACYVVRELLSEGHYIVYYQVEPKIQYNDCESCLKEQHRKDITNARIQYIVEWKEKHCDVEKIQQDFCSFVGETYKYYLKDAYGIDCADSIKQGKYYIRYEIDRLDLLKEPCVCTSTLCYPVCLLDLTAYGEYPIANCIIPSIESMDFSICAVVGLESLNINGYQPSCYIPEMTVDAIILDANNPGCSYNNISITINSIVAS